jgi:homoserine kinase
MNGLTQEATAFAPATIANVAVGFDVLGFAFDDVGDRVTVRRSDSPGVRIASVSGESLPADPQQNTAGVALLSMIEDLDLEQGFEVALQKGIPLSSGLGGSAASAVGAVVAANHLLEMSRSREDLLPYALAGEAVASGAAHGDNVVPCLFGGLVAVIPGVSGMTPVHLPVPNLHCVLVRPNIQLATKAQRQVLPATISLTEHARQSAYLAGFVSALHTGDVALMRTTMQDLIVGPCRSTAIPGFNGMRSAAMDSGAVGCGISGSGPTVFAWCDAEIASSVQDAMLTSLQGQAESVDSWSGAVGGVGARVVEEL